jgi:VCBS repeat-containing protein
MASGSSGFQKTDNLAIESAGGHSHTVTIANTGSGTAFDIMPPYYSLAYIMKL